MIAFGLAARWLHLACGLALVGAFSAGLLAGRSDRPTARDWESRLAAWTRWAVVFLLLSGMATLAYQAAVVAGRAAAALEPAVWLRLLLESHFGTVWLLRHGILLLLAALILFREREESPADWIALRAEAWLLAAAGTAAMAWAGHAAAVEPAGLRAALVDALHLTAVGVWLGALLPLALLLRSASTEAGADSRPFAVLAVRRFSSLALVAMLVIVATGIGNAAIQVGGVPALVGTRYGRLLLLKLALLVAILGLASANRRLLPALSGDGATVGRPAMARLGRFIACEGALALGILALTAALSLTPPARHESPSWPFARRLSYEVASTVPGGSTRLLIGSQLAFVGVLGAIVGALLKRRRGVFVGAGAAAVVAGLWVALPPMAVDAYPTTYRRSAVPYQAASVANGMALYRAHCAECHGRSGTGDGPGGAGLRKRPADLTAPHTAQHTAGDLFWWITHGVGPSGMPAFGQRLSEEERWDVINFLRALSAGERARGLAAGVEPSRPWLAAPDFAYSVGPVPARSLKEFRGRWMVLLVLFSLPDSRARLGHLAGAYSTIEVMGTEIVAVPVGGGGPIISRLGAEPRILFAVVTDGAADIERAYSLFSLTRSSDAALAAPPSPRHAEFLIDRQGYLRARWLPGGAGTGWGDLSALFDEIRALDREAPAAPPPDEHVH